jgi:hypothetical protein
VTTNKQSPYPLPITPEVSLGLAESGPPYRSSPPRLLVRRGIVSVQDLLKHFVNLACHENANVPLLIGWRKKNNAADYGANVRDKFSKFFWLARHKVYFFHHGGLSV